MATFDEIASGGIKLRGCAWFYHLEPLITLYIAGDVLYNIHKARRGVLERVVIKKPRTVQNIRTQGAPVVMYVDTLNGLWNEYDLVAFSAAQSLVDVYLTRMQAELVAIDPC